ncbi:MAG TPA: hypothetical protein VF831_10860, partial [Anaerolineales bacterium]
MADLNDFRKMKDAFFANDGQSPLTITQKKDFKGLIYFPPNPDLNLVVSIEEFPEMGQIKMQT